MKETSLAALMDQFDVFLLDQFGVLIDSVQAYPGAPEVVSEMAARGKTIGILTNSGKRSVRTEERLAAMGFDMRAVANVTSSGEAARSVLSGMIGADVPKGAPVLVLSRDDDTSCIDGLDLTRTDDPDKAALILIAGSRGEELSLEDYAAILGGPAARGVYALCTNPDITMLTPKGPAFGAGRIAELYRTLGGEVEEIGKPHPLIYRVALERLGAPDPARVLCVGDSPAHDIRGAHGAGCVAALTRTGIHADAPLTEVLAKAPASDHPDFVIPSFAL